MTGMNPRTHPRGAAPDFTFPSPNPNPSRVTDALWWLVCMRERLEPSKSGNGGNYADKPGYHNIGDNLPNYGEGDSRTDHSIRRAPDRSGPWWKTKSSAHDWTFFDAQNGNYETIDKYTTRLVNAMKDPNDPRPDDVYAYTLGQMDGDTVVEGYNEYTNMPETSSDKTHNWHRHDSFRRNIIGSFAHMWKALTIDMGWTYAEYLQSLEDPEVAFDDETITIGSTTAAVFYTPAANGTEKKASEILQLGAIAAKRAETAVAALTAATNAQTAQIIAAVQASELDENQVAAAMAPQVALAIQTALADMDLDGSAIDTVTIEAALRAVFADAATP